MNLTLNRNRIFTQILMLGLIANFAVIFNIQFLFLRPLISFIFLTIVPGLLLMLILKVRNINPWVYLLYILGLSLGFLMFGGLFINWTLALFGFSKPLSIIPLLVNFDLFLLTLGYIALNRNKDVALKIKIPKLNLLNWFFFIVPLIFLALTTFGALIINNNGPNIVSMIALGEIAVYVYLILLFRNKLNPNIYPYAILFISLSLLLATSLRSWYLFGSDITTEYYMFKLTRNGFFWTMSNFPKHPYNACLSITILPTIFYSFMKINDLYIFKLLMQLIFSFSPLASFFLFKKYARKILAFIATFLYISTQMFFFVMPMHTREEIALLFFSLMLLISFNKKISLFNKKILFLIFGFSMAVSHYSTAYIAIIIFFLTYFASRIFVKFRIKVLKTIPAAIKSLRQSCRHFKGSSLILLFVFTLLWYVQVTEASGNLVNFTQKNKNNFVKIIFNKGLRIENIKSKTYSVIKQFNIFYKPNLDLMLQKYVEEGKSYKTKEFNDFYEEENYASYEPKVISPDILTSKLDEKGLSKIYLLREIIKKIVKIFMIIGVFYLLFTKLKKHTIDQEYIILCVVGFFLLVTKVVSPYTSNFFCLDRFYLQLLTFLSLPTVFGGLFLLRFIPKIFRRFLLITVFLLNFLFLSGFVAQLFGGDYLSTQLNNAGVDYNTLYSHDSEIKSSKWLFDNFNQKSFVYADEFVGKKVLLSYKFKDLIKHVILPQIIPIDSYVYLGYANVTKKSAFIYLREITMGYNYPLDFLNENKNLIYNNAGSKIFK